jgi:hypothetical protein
MAWMQRMKMRARMLLDRGRAGDRLTAELDHHIEATDGGKHRCRHERRRGAGGGAAHL